VGKEHDSASISSGGGWKGPLNEPRRVIPAGAGGVSELKDAHRELSDWFGQVAGASRTDWLGGGRFQPFLGFPAIRLRGLRI